MLDSRQTQIDSTKKNKREREKQKKKRIEPTRMNLYFSFGVILLGQFIAKLNRVIFSTTAFFIALVLQNNLNCLVPSSGFRVFVHFISVSVSFVCLDQVRAFKYAFTAHSCCCVFFQIVRDLRAQYCLSFRCLGTYTQQR